MASLSSNPVASADAQRTLRASASPRPPVPREHGAWGILLIPFATAIGVAGVWNLPVALLLVSVLCFYVARTSYLKRNFRWTGILLAGSVAAAAPLVLVWQLWWLAAFGAVGAVLGFRKTERGVPLQLLAVAGLTLTAPAAWYVATGKLDYRLWLLNALYFAGGVFYVKMHIAAAMNRGRDEAVRATLLYYGMVPVVMVALASGGVVGWWVLLAFAPVVARAVVGVVRLTPTLRIRRLGWTEVAHSLVWAIILVATLR